MGKKAKVILGPDRSLTNANDANNINYFSGNRKYRRELAFAKIFRYENDIPLSKKIKLVKKLWKKGKSKFLLLRLKEMYGNGYLSHNITNIK